MHEVAHIISMHIRAVKYLVKDLVELTNISTIQMATSDQEPVHRYDPAGSRNMVNLDRCGCLVVNRRISSVCLVRIGARVVFRVIERSQAAYGRSKCRLLFNKCACWES